MPRQGDEDIMIQAPNQDTQALPNDGKNETTDEEKIQTPHFEVKTEAPWNFSLISNEDFKIMINGSC